VSTQFDKPASRDLNQLLSELHRHRGAAFALHTEPAIGHSPEQALPSVPISGITYNSKKVEPGDIFVSIEGQKVDGDAYIAEAIEKGARAVVSQKQSGPYSVPLIVVSDVRAALACLAGSIYDYPSQKLRLLGVTGTNGKTTTTHLIEHILGTAGLPVGLIGTLGARMPAANNDSGSNGKNGDSQTTSRSQAVIAEGDDDPLIKRLQGDQAKAHYKPGPYIDIKHTTPQASDLEAMLATMVHHGMSHVAMEVSSHALALKRVFGVHFASACLTNISQDHLDFHNTMEHYWQSKRILFEMLAESSGKRTAVINFDDALAAKFIEAVPRDVELITYGFSSEANLHVLEKKFDFSGTRLKLATPSGIIDFTTRLSGNFNLYNVMAAMAVCMGEGLSKEEIAAALTDFAGVSGRFEVVPAASAQVSAPLCLVDYAHTPDGLQNVLNTARDLVPVGGKLIAIFGCGGDRDTSKRPQMGHIAEDLADQLVITSDNPRSEDPMLIINDILSGLKRLKKVTVEVDRARAIRHTVMAASPQDVVVIAGKGHETYQILRDKTIDFDDRLEVSKALHERTGGLKGI
jgi:UDP-N-acetylmuramoyl-L-alanyl-D-glutamate--2,6-diaminopimelate ligase